MKLSLRLVGMVALAAMLAACHRGNDITFDGHSVSLHAGGQPTATITSRGSFSVGSKLIDVTPAQRQLFLRYYNRIATIQSDAQTLKQAGWNLTGKAMRVAGQSITSAVAGSASTSARTTGQATSRNGTQMQQRAVELCHSIQQARALQTTLGKQLSAFQPYATIDPAPNVQCGHDSTVG